MWSPRHLHGFISKLAVDLPEPVASHLHEGGQFPGLAPLKSLNIVYAWGLGRLGFLGFRV